MGKKKKGGGAEKTAAKTEKKLVQKMKKQLDLAGEEDITAIVKQIEKEEQEKQKVVVKIISTPPTRRAHFSLVAHPEKDELILFGGEFYNGKATDVYNDLFVYNISKDEWRVIRTAGGPGPRSGHQSVAVPACKGQMWMFGGEYTTKSESQFHHYRDLWCLSLDSYRWEKISSPGGPSSRSGHRMVLMKKKLFVFGGYHDNLIEYKYFNDVYVFSLDDRIWNKIEPAGIGPCPRSACQLVPVPDGTLLLWGGYSKVKLKKDLEKGQVHNDMFLLHPPKPVGDGEVGKYKWSVVKSKGAKPTPLSGVSVACDGLKAYTFGGAQDTDTEEDLTTQFFNQLHSLHLSSHIWTLVTLSGKKSSKTNRRRRGKGEESDEEKAELEDVGTEYMKVIDDGVFVTKIGGPSASTEQTLPKEKPTAPPSPHPRMNAAAVIKSSKLFIYGGLFEDDDVVWTLGDMHILDLQKCDEWKELISCDIGSQDWFESEESNQSSSSSSSSDEDSRT